MSIDKEKDKKGFKPQKKKEYKLALELYINTTYDAKKIAELVDVSENTISSWINSQNWEEMKGGIILTPYMIERNLLRNAAIKSADPKTSGDEMVKMANAIEKFKTDKTSLVNVFEVFHRFNEYLMTFEEKEAIQFLLTTQEYQDKFVSSITS